jgi:hypothetical protein
LLLSCYGWRFLASFWADALECARWVPIGSHGHLAIFCPCKVFGLPDGAAVISDVPVKHPSLGRRKEISHDARWIGRNGEP